LKGASVTDYSQAYEAKWRQFLQLTHTHDSAVEERRGLRRWRLLPYIAVVLPVDDPVVVAQLVEWQRALQSWFPYDPMPADQFHITLNYIGLQRRNWWDLLWMQTWRRDKLLPLIRRIERIVPDCTAFDIRIGPLNAFSNVLFAEIQDDHQCLRRLRARVRRALPLRARPVSQWAYLPHITLGLWGQQPVAPLINALRPFREVEPIPFRMTRMEFTIYTRDAVPFGPDLLTTSYEEVLAKFSLKES
jgi:2'-5' RNA ligase